MAIFANSYFIHADRMAGALAGFAPGVDSVEICASPIPAVRAAGRPAPDGATLGLADLASEPLIMIGRGKTWRSDIDVAFRRAGIAPRVAVETQSVGSACGFARTFARALRAAGR